jgi:hypothetical protein
MPGVPEADLLMKDEVRTANTPKRDMQNTKNIRWKIG